MHRVLDFMVIAVTTTIDARRQQCVLHHLIEERSRLKRNSAVGIKDFSRMSAAWRAS